LPLHADRSVALLGEGGRIKDEDALGSTQLLGDLGGQPGEPGVVIPGRLANELLQGLAGLVELKVVDSVCAETGRRRWQGQRPASNPKLKRPSGSCIVQSRFSKLQRAGPGSEQRS
jgi:hypothetical protein